MPGAGASRERNGSALLRNVRDLLLVVMDLIEIYQCFCDRTRLRILNLLTRSPLCVCHFQDILGEPQVKISKHLAYLRSRGMVATKREQNWIIYSLPEQTGGRIGTKSKMFTGLRSNRCGVQTRYGEAFQTCKELL